MNITPRQRAVLEYIARQRDRVYGPDLVDAGLADRWTLFVQLGRLEDAGLVDGRPDDRWPHRRTYAITDQGRAALLPEARINQHS